MKIGHARVSTRDQNLDLQMDAFQGRLIFKLIASFAEFERELISERTMAGLRRIRENGRIGCKKIELNDATKKKAYAALQLTTANNEEPWKDKHSVNDIAKVLGISAAK